MRKSGSLTCTVLLIPLTFWALHDAVPHASGRIALQVAAAAELGAPRHTEVENVVSAVSARTGPQRATEQQVVSVLQKLGKTLILERTRGPKEVELYRKAAPAVVLVVTQEGFGSGAIINGQGDVITNGHVVRAYPAVVVVFKPKDGTDLKKELAFRATVEKVDQVTDLALLKITMPPKTFASLPLGDGSMLAVGQDVHAIGHPAGEVWTHTKYRSA